MLPSKHRIPRTLFGRLRQATTVSSELLILRLVKVTGQSRFSVSVSKKVAKKATKRNRIRRLSYKEIATLLPNIKDSYLVSISYKKSPLEGDINRNIHAILKQSKLLKTI